MITLSRVLLIKKTKKDLIENRLFRNVYSLRRQTGIIFIQIASMYYQTKN